MARVRRNVLVEGLAGMLAEQLVFKQDKAGRTIVSICPALMRIGSSLRRNWRNRKDFRKLPLMPKMPLKPRQFMPRKRKAKPNRLTM